MAKQTYINKGGQHVLADGTKVERGERFDCDDPDLRVNFPNKFELVNVDEKPVNAPPPVAAKPAPAPKPDKDEPEDVTKDFTVDQDGNLTVLKDKKGWNVFEEGDEEPLNEKPLKKKDVQPFIDEYLDEDSEEEEGEGGEEEEGEEEGEGEE